MAEQVEPEEGRGRTVRQLQRGDVDGVHGDVIMMQIVALLQSGRFPLLE
jgi:hypothetical protein